MASAAPAVTFLFQLPKKFFDDYPRHVRTLFNTMSHKSNIHEGIITWFFYEDQHHCLMTYLELESLTRIPVPSVN